MNQILFENEDNTSSSYSKKTNKKNKAKTFFKFQFTICSIVTLSTIAYYSYSLYQNSKKEALSKKLLNNYSITTLYDNADYTTTRTAAQSMYIAEDTNFSVIGLIEIKSIKINYPIISSYNNELLKIAPCRFMGPMPNEEGNLCIAGHNYNSYKFFSKLKDLSNGDIITIYDLSRKKSKLFGI